MTYMQDVVFWIDERTNTAIHGMAERMSVHTGVKWQLQRTPYESEIDIVSDGRVIATVEVGDGQEKVAQMMVAAPDMLEALVGAKWAMESNISEQFREQMEEYQAVVKAISKARGEE